MYLDLWEKKGNKREKVVLVKGWNINIFLA